MIELLSAMVSVDYITATATEFPQQEAFDVMASSTLSRLALDGYNVGPFRFFGYEGFKAGDYAYGSRHDGAIIRAWGEMADDCWREVALHAGNITRIDLCIDCLFAGAVSDLARLGWKSMEADEAARSHSFVQSSDGGQTLYVGSRSSERMARLYDKGVQLKRYVPGVMWRYEMEYKGAMAFSVTRDLLERDLEDQINQMAYLVHDYFTINGLSPAFPRMPGRYVARPPVKRLAGDELLEWLRRQVRPSVMRLCGIGRSDEVFEALGLDQV